jgi:hypothetical protein
MEYENLRIKSRSMEFTLIRPTREKELVDMMNTPDGKRMLLDYVSEDLQNIFGDKWHSFFDEDMNAKLNTRADPFPLGRTISKKYEVLLALAMSKEGYVPMSCMYGINAGGFSDYLTAGEGLEIAKCINKNILSVKQDDDYHLMHNDYKNEWGSLRLEWKFSMNRKVRRNSTPVESYATIMEPGKFSY